MAAHLPPGAHISTIGEEGSRKLAGILREETGGSTCRPVNLALHCHALSLCR